MQEAWIQFLGQEDPLEKEMPTHSNILAWRNLWTEEPNAKSSSGVAKSSSGVAKSSSGVAKSWT